VGNSCPCKGPPFGSSPDNQNMNRLKLGRPWLGGGLFLAVVALPTAAAVLYFSAFASDVYISESRFVVRSPSVPPSAGLGSVLQGVGLSRASDDALAVHDYVVSRDALRQLEANLGLSRSFGAPTVDRLSRFAGIDPDGSFEALHRYYLRRVSIAVDGVSAISVLRTSAFSAPEALRMNQMLLEAGEQLVNQINERSRQDTLRQATEELAQAEKRSRAAAAAIAQFRSDKSVFDPDRQSALQLQLVSKLQDELISARTQLAQVQELARDNPQIAPLQRRVEAMQREIAAETAKVVGPTQSLSGKSAAFSILETDRMLADKQLAAALLYLEQARREALRKQLYLERIVEPSLPDSPVEPRRLRGVAATFALGLLAWGILSLLVAGVREHRH
jgi:capsular polysaccharide transport system permease protein